MNEPNKELQTNKIIVSDCIEGMIKIADNSIDCVVTSPPYDSIRQYNGFTLNLNSAGREIYRVLKPGGIAALVIQDQTKNFGKSLTSFRTVIDWCDNIGFKLFECAIYRKHGAEGAWWVKRFRVDHEYIAIFLKGDRPQFFDKEPLKVLSKHGGKVMTGSGSRRTDGKTNKAVTIKINLKKCRGTIWEYLNAGDKDPIKRKHPAPFPDILAEDIIRCFCQPGGLVLDPFIGSGSSAVAAIRYGRKYIGFEVSEDYAKIAQARIENAAKEAAKKL